MLPILIILIVSLTPTPFEKGEVSYYSNKESASITACGEQFDDTKLTLAMLKGEFNRYYLITCNTGMVIARLNDRGPYIKGRVADLSKKAMEQISDDGLVEAIIFELPFKRSKI